MNVIERAQSEWGSLVVFSLKQDGSLGLCIDYIKQNAVAVKYVYPIQVMNKFLDLLGEARIFLTFVPNYGY